MTRQRRTSAVLETARQHLAGLKSIIPTPDFGGNLTVRLRSISTTYFDRMDDNRLTSANMRRQNDERDW